MTPTPTKKEWCGHIVRDLFFGFKIEVDGRTVIVPQEWTRCPVCGKERPKG